MENARIPASRSAAAAPGLDVGHVETGAPGELDRLEVVVGEKLGAVLSPVVGQRLDPVRHPHVALDAVRPR
jgi:hypothetical protein